MNLVELLVNGLKELHQKTEKLEHSEFSTLMFFAHYHAGNKNEWRSKTGNSEEEIENLKIYVDNYLSKNVISEELLVYGLRSIVTEIINRNASKDHIDEVIQRNKDILKQDENVSTKDKLPSAQEICNETIAKLSSPDYLIQKQKIKNIWDQICLSQFSQSNLDKAFAQKFKTRYSVTA